MIKYDVLIVGGGPAGLAAAIYTTRAKLKTLVFAGSPPGGQLMLTTEVENYPGFKSILGPELVQRMREQAKDLGAEIVDRNIVQLNLSGSSFELIDSDTEKYCSDSVIVAVGARAKWLGLESEQRLIGKGVSACATCDGFFFKDKVVAVVGGGDTAMEEALVLTKFAKKVYIIHRRDSFRASKVMQERVFKNPKIEIIWNAVVQEVLGKDKVEGVKLKIKIPKSEHQASNKLQLPNSNFQKLKEEKFGDWSLVIGVLPLDGLFVAIGHKPDTEVFKDKIDLDEKGYVITTARVMEEYTKFIKFQIPNTKYQINFNNQNLKQENKFIDLFEKWPLDLLNYRTATSVPGIFAAGDCVDYIYRQAATAVGMGVSAALEVERWLEAKK